MEEARALFRDPDTTEFVIVTIPTVMAAAESARLAKALRAESVPVHTILINQVCTHAILDVLKPVSQPSTVQGRQIQSPWWCFHGE